MLTWEYNNLLSTVSYVHEHCKPPSKSLLSRSTHAQSVVFSNGQSLVKHLQFPVYIVKPGLQTPKVQTVCSWRLLIRAYSTFALRMCAGRRCRGRYAGYSCCLGCSSGSCFLLGLILLMIVPIHFRGFPSIRDKMVVKVRYVLASFNNNYQGYDHRFDSTFIL
jgi:hypothetical protein